MRILGPVLAVIVCSLPMAIRAEPGVIRLQRREPDYVFRFRPDYRVEGQRPFALALRGGSAKGLAHLGVFQGLDEENLTADAIVGTSAGSLMGSLYASGFSADGIARIFKSRDFGLAFDDRRREAGWSLSEDEVAHATPYRLRLKDGKPDLIPGKTTSRKVRANLMPMLGRASWLAAGDFDRLRVPFRAVASDLTAGTGKVFSGGSLVDVVMASMCLPGVFEPVEIDGHQYMDGGPFENLPVQTARREFPGMIQVGVAIGRPWDQGPKDNIVSLLDAALDLAMAQTEARSEASADLIIRPGIGPANDFDFHRQVDALVREGRGAFDAQRVALEDLLYGPGGRAQAASSCRLEAPDVPGAQAWFAALVPPGPVAFRDLYRALRRAHRDLPVSGAEVRLPTDPGGEAALVLSPARIVTKLEIDLPAEWPSDASRSIQEDLARRYGLAVGRRFHEGAWNQFIEELLVEGILNQVPILDVRGSGFSAEGTLRLRLREMHIDRIHAVDPSLQGDFDRLLANLKDGPIRTDALAEDLSRATSRLGLSTLRPEIRQQDGVLALELESVKAPSVELAPHLAYESTWGAHVALDAACSNVFGTGSRLLFHGAVNDLRARLQGQWLDLLRPLPGVELGVGGSYGKQWFDADRYVPVEKLTEGRFWGRAQTRFGRQDRGLLQLDLGQERGFARVAGGDLPWNRAEYGRLALEWDSLDAHTLPTEGTMIRSAFTRAFRAERGPLYTAEYFRARRLWPGGDSIRTPGLDLDLEVAAQQDAPRERWYIVGGPDSLIGTPSASFLTPNFGIVRIGFPFTLATLFGVAVQGVPRFDVGRFAADSGHLDDGMHATGCGLVLRGVVRSFYVELAGGRVRVRDTETNEVDHVRHFSFLIGTRPFDLWKDR